MATATWHEFMIVFELAAQLAPLCQRCERTWIFILLLAINVMVLILIIWRVFIFWIDAPSRTFIFELVAIVTTISI